MAASATALLLAGTGVAYAGNCSASTDRASRCIDVAATVAQPVVIDLTRVSGGALPSSVTSQSAATATSQLVPGITITNTADITVVRPDDAFGLNFTSTGPVTLRNSGALDITSTDAVAEGIFVYGSDVLVRNSGQIDATGDEGATGIEAHGSEGARVINSGAITATAETYAFGMVALARAGDTLAINRGAITTSGYYSFGVEAGSDYGDVTVRNSGDFEATGTGLARGVFAVAGGDGSTTITNTGHVAARGIDYAGAATGVVGRSYGGDVSIRNHGDVAATNVYGAALAVAAEGAGGDLTVVNLATGRIVATATGAGIYGSAFGIRAGFGLYVGVDNAGSITASSEYGVAAGVVAAGYFVDVSNSGDINVAAARTADAPADAFGIYAYGVYAAHVSNKHDITAASATGLADGIFASGTDVEVFNCHCGTIAATGFDWAAGIEAQGYNSAEVVNKGSITATAAAGDPVFDPYGYGHVIGFTTGGAAYGVYATGGAGGASVDNAAGGSIVASAAQAIGIHAYNASTGPTLVDNAGDIAAAGYYATGIDALTNVEGNAVSVDNSGDISATGYLRGTGIQVTATGVGTRGNVVNSGDITVDAPGFYGAGIGVSVAADGDAGIRNFTDGSIGVYGNFGPNYGAQALSLDGIASVVNDGDITVAGAFYFAGYGAAAFSQNGTARVDNSGQVTVTRGTFGVIADGGYGTNVSNSGTIAISGGMYNFAVQATSNFGDVVADNSGTIVAGSDDYGSGFVFGYGFGLLARARLGDALVTNSGSITTSGTYSYGIEAVADVGDVSVGNAATGVVTAYGTGGGPALGIFGVALGDGGDVAIDNAGRVAATAITYTIVAIGVDGRSDGGDVAITNSGTIDASNAYADALARQDAIGVSVASPLGASGVTNRGTITATALGLADGIFVSGGDVLVRNAGQIDADGLEWSAGIEAQSSTSARVVNRGAIAATAGYSYGGIGLTFGEAYGVYATGGTDGMRVTNIADGHISATASLAQGIHAFNYDGPSVWVGNAGQVAATGYYASGIVAASPVEGSLVRVDNRGGITADGQLAATGIDALAAGFGSSVQVSNSGTIDAYAGSTFYGNTYYATGTGILASADGDATVTNAGDITAGVYAGISYGVLATSLAGTTRVSNSGDITVTGGRYDLGLVADGGAGTRAINTGTIDVSGGRYNFALQATSNFGDVAAINRGTIIAGAADASDSFAFGVLARARQGDTLVSNSGSINATGNYFTYGIEAIADLGDVSVINAATGVVTAYVYAGGEAMGILGVALGAGGDVAIDNAGSVTANIIESTDVATGVEGRAYGGDVAITNSGDILASNAFEHHAERDAFGISANASSGTSEVTNRGTITAIAYGYVYGIAARGSDVLVRNAGQIDATSLDLAKGIFAHGSASAQVDNRGVITATAAYGQGYNSSYSATGVDARSDDGDVMITNSGDIHAIDAHGFADYRRHVIGISTASPMGASEVTNRGTITAVTAYGDAGGIFASGSDVLVRNRGQIDVAGGASATGIGAISTSGDVRVNNVGSITATSQYGVAKGVYATGDNVTVTNSGDITATTGTSDAYNAIGVQIGAESSASFTNTGEIHTATSTGTGIAVLIESNGSLNFTNSGILEGAIITHAGDDAFTSTAGSTWDLINQSTDLGAGSDRVTNVAGAAIKLFNGLIDLGEGENSFRNDGLITVHGDSVIDMGSGGSARPGADGRPGRGGDWTATPRDPKPLPLFNNGTIDLVNGAGNDHLTIAGDLAGRGWIDVDMVGSQVADYLEITGSLRPNAVQTVNVSFHGLPGVGGDTMTFARVGGDSSAGSFVAGQVFGAEPSNFMNLGVDILSRIDASNVNADTFDASVQATGLNDAGSLAASLGASVQGLMTSQIGTWRQRTGVVPDATLDRRVNAYVRSFNDQGNVNATNNARNFGQGGNFAFGQANAGTQVGVGFAPGNGFNLGFLMGKSSGQQNLTGAGFGRDSVLADSVGVSGTWVSPKGFYFDASYWSMDFNARMDSAAGRQALRGRANALNVESGYTYRLSSGVNLEPQFQYTWTKVDQLLLQGSDADFQSNEDAWRRTRVGLMAWKAIPDASGRLWMPYGSVSAVRLEGGDAGYAVNDTFLGNLDVRGNSVLVEAGVGMQKGGFSANAALNWTDGDTVDSLVGGELVLRYGW